MDQPLVNCVKNLKALFILGGDIVPAKDPNHLGLGWRSLVGTEKDKTDAMPSFERVLAGAAAYRINPKLTLVPSGGESNLPGQTGKSPAISTIMAAELRAAGVPAANIVEEPQSFVTRDHFVYCPEIAKAHGWGPSDIGISSIFFHFGRITGGLAAVGKSAEPFVLGVTRLLSSERLLANEDETWNARFKELYASADMIPTLVGEAMGTGQLWTGHSPKFPHPFRGFRDPLEE